MFEEQILSAEQFFKNAETALQQKDLLDFISNISNAELLARTANNTDILPQVTFLKIKGLFQFSKHQKVLKDIPQALKYNSTALHQVRLNNYKGTSLVHLGHLDQAITIFKALLQDINEVELLLETYLNIIWANLLHYATKGNEEDLIEAKEYIDLANEQFDQASSLFQCKIKINSSVYYCYLKDYDVAIKLLEEAISLAEEQQLPSIYNNLADLYLKSDQYGVSSCVHDYVDKAEVLGTQFDDNLEIGKSFYTRAMAELREDQLFSALDSLYISFEYFKKAQSLTYAFDCLVKINEISSDYKLERLKSLGNVLKHDFEDTPLYAHI